MLCNEQEVTTIDRAEIQATEKLIRPYIRHTPIISVQCSDFGLEGGSLILKLELLQYTGSFKVRGAFSNLLTRDIPAAGVVAASGGNHGVAVAYAASKRDVPARIFVPSIASPTKIDQIRGCRAELVVIGDRYADALAASEDWTSQSGALPIHAFDQHETLLGQGTVALEFEAQEPALDSLLVSVGGGGLIGGIAAWFTDRIRIIGVEPEQSPTLHAALEAGQPVDAPVGGIAADSLAPRRVGEQMFTIAQQHIEDVILVSDDDIRRAQWLLWDTVRVVAEPGGVTALAAVICGGYRPKTDERVGVLICGSNTVAVDFDR